MITTRSFTKLTAFVAVASLGLGACADSPILGGRAQLQTAPLALSISSRGAEAGERVAVGVTLESSDAAGIQGTLRFDAARLRYVGQAPEGEAITLVNNKRAELGELRFTSFNPEGVSGRVAVLVFETIARDYASSISYEHQVASTTELVSLPVQVIGGVREDRSLAVASDARHLSLAEWGARSTLAGKSTKVALRPGEYRLNLAYGDVDFDAAIGLFDYLAVANAAIGADEIIVGTDGPAVDVDLVIAGNVFPQNAAGAYDTETDGRRILDLFDYLAIANEALGVNENCVGDVIPGRSAAPTDTQTLGPLTTPGLIVNANDTLRLTNDKIWILDGTLDVRDGGVLEIQAGTRIEGLVGSTQTTALFVQRGGKIFANGTQNQPIVMTCTGADASKVKGCWGGVFIAGKGTVNIGDGTLGPAPDGGNQRRGEGNAPLYGGVSPNDNSGVMRYVVIEFGGRVVTQDSELNGLTLGGVGRGTTIEYIQIHGGTDDGIEFFGGEVNTRYLVLTGNDDDQFDVSFGYTGENQFVIAQSDAGNSTGDSKAIEADGNEPAPGQILAVRTAPMLYNFTLIGNLNQVIAANVGAIHLRRANGLTLANSIVAGYSIGLDIDDPLTCDSWGTGAVKILSTTFIDIANLGNNDGSDPACVVGGSTTEGEEDFINAEATNRTRTGLASVLRDGTNTSLPDWRMLLVTGAAAEAGTSAVPAGSTFIIPTTYRGAVPPAVNGELPWYSGWTRGFRTATTP